ncbi:hypothetical protein E4U59_001776 [Claviceps monticola]|nr:hypothetical protein E4U59_001776 [Claviceps monticola]
MSLMKQCWDTLKSCPCAAVPTSYFAKPLAVDTPLGFGYANKAGVRARIYELIHIPSSSKTDNISSPLASRLDRQEVDVPEARAEKCASALRALKHLRGLSNTVQGIYPGQRERRSLPASFRLLFMGRRSGTAAAHVPKIIAQDYGWVISLLQWRYVDQLVLCGVKTIFGSKGLQGLLKVCVDSADGHVISIAESQLRVY